LHRLVEFALHVSRTSKKKYEHGAVGVDEAATTDPVAEVDTSSVVRTHTHTVVAHTQKNPKKNTGSSNGGTTLTFGAYSRMR
jgi:hypothetical protein